MEPFNIRILHDSREVTLTILPEKEGYYKVIYFGGVLGAVQCNLKTKQWEFLSTGQIIVGTLPLYKHDVNTDHPDLVLNESNIALIGNEIEHIVNP